MTCGVVTVEFENGWRVAHCAMHHFTGPQRVEVGQAKMDAGFHIQSVPGGSGRIIVQPLTGRVEVRRA